VLLLFLSFDYGSHFIFQLQTLIRASTDIWQLCIAEVLIALLEGGCCVRFSSVSQGCFALLCLLVNFFVFVRFNDLLLNSRNHNYNTFRHLRVWSIEVGGRNSLTDVEDLL
jgi:hypothetical protein